MKIRWATGLRNGAPRRVILIEDERAGVTYLNATAEELIDVIKLLEREQGIDLPSGDQLFVEYWFSRAEESEEE